MGRILILGATGRIGGLVADALSQMEGCELLVASSRDSGRQALAARFPKAEARRADWYDLESLVGAMDGVERMFVVTPDFHTDEAALCTNLIAAAKASGTLKQIVRLIAVPPGLTADQLTPEALATRTGANLHVIAKPLLDASGLPVTYVNVPAWFMAMIPAFLSAEVKASRRATMPEVSNRKRMMVSEVDIAAVVAKVLTEPAENHVGREYVLTNSERVDFSDIARMLGDELGVDIEYANDDRPLRKLMGPGFDQLMSYLRTEGPVYEGVTHSECIAELLGRPQVSVREYIRTNRDLFL